ncbi:hypothetical protein JX265_002618 [Neoarthrinium moseri]|uniref:Heterokaryon incompatibility domain-containing protein n=1 Tax=Neoarthrinium moseri TaxID=1658444 RepID=A0A9P9WUS6_9PEZI|nr:hypothetical protein JX266_011021 [Neoarthrinium moseri]KAI1879664.1 hypothetical protein JX265_002618 [Neoarthrinium moseri]
MGRIYAGADAVFAWLGPANHKLEPLFKSFSPAIFDLDGLYTSLWIGQSDKLPMECVRAVEDIASRPYWKRGWIRQELHFAKRVNLICGQTMIPAGQLSHVLESLPSGIDQEPDISDLKRHISSAMNYFSWKANKSLLDLLEAYGASECSVKHDRIYSLLPMASDSPEARGYRVEYGWSYEEVVVKTAAFCECSSAEQRHRLLLTLGDKAQVDEGYSTSLDNLSRCCDYIARQHEDGMSWADTMNMSYDLIRQNAGMQQRRGIQARSC